MVRPIWPVQIEQAYARITCADIDGMSTYELKARATKIDAIAGVTGTDSVAAKDGQAAREGPEALLARVRALAMRVPAICRAFAALDGAAADRRAPTWANTGHSRSNSPKLHRTRPNLRVTMGIGPRPKFGRTGDWDVSRGAGFAFLRLGTPATQVFGALNLSRVRDSVGRNSI